MKNLIDYWKKIEFEYLKTYSGLRGETFEWLEKQINQKVIALKEELKTARFMQKSKINHQINSLLDEIDVYNSIIINEKGEFHQSTIEITRKEKPDEFVKKIDSILNLQPNREVASGCPPIFRDAIVFYSKKDEINGILQICFECATIKNEDEESLKTNEQTYSKLADLLKEVGHQIE